jgi:hypothetical protein
MAKNSLAHHTVVAAHVGNQRVAEFVQAQGDNPPANHKDYQQYTGQRVIQGQAVDTVACRNGDQQDQRENGADANRHPRGGWRVRGRSKVSLIHKVFPQIYKSENI